MRFPPRQSGGNLMTTNEKKQILIPMVTTIEAALDYGYSMNDIRQWRIGNRMCTVVLIPGTKEQYNSYLSSFFKESKAEDRDKRCQISDGKGHAIRCPESNKCKDCPFYHSIDKKDYGTLTFSDLSWTNEDGIEEAYEPIAPEGYSSAERYLELLQELMRYVEAIRPEYALVVKLLSDGLTRREIAKELGVPKSTVIDWVKKIQELTLKFMEDII